MPIAAYCTATTQGLELAMLANSRGAYAMFVRQGDETLLSAVDVTLNSLEADGTLTQLQRQWGIQQA